MLSAYAILLPVSFRYASRSFDHPSRYVYFLGFVFVWNHLFNLGFFNFCLSLVGYLFFLGYWSRTRNRLGLSQVSILIGLSLLIYLCNGLSYYLAAATVGLLSLGAILAERSRIDTWWKAVAKPQLGALLAVPLSVAFFALHGRSQLIHSSHLTLGSVAWTITRAPILVSSFNAVDLKLSEFFSLVLLMATMAAVYVRRRRRTSLVYSDLLLAAAGLQLILYVALPERALGGGEINYRVLLLAMVTLALWITLQPQPRPAVVGISLSAAVVCISLVARNLQRDLWLSAALNEYRKAESRMEEHKSFLRLQFEVTGYGSTRDPGLRYDPFLNASALIALERNLVDLDNYETASRNFPIIYRPGFDPMTVIRNEGSSAYRPLADISQYEAMTGRPVDYVMIWDLQRWSQTTPLGKMALQQLYRNYVPIYCARDIPLQLYQRRGEVNSAGVAPDCALSIASSSSQ